jgi:hypothetical protein
VFRSFGVSDLEDPLSSIVGIIPRSTKICRILPHGEAPRVVPFAVQNLSSSSRARYRGDCH